MIQHFFLSKCIIAMYYLLRAQSIIYLMADLRQNEQYLQYVLYFFVFKHSSLGFYKNTVLLQMIYKSNFQSQNLIILSRSKKLAKYVLSIRHSSIKLGTKILTSNQINNLADLLPQKPDTIFIFQIYMYQISICDLIIALGL